MDGGVTSPAVDSKRRAIVVHMSNSLTIRRDAQVDADLEILVPAFGSTTAAVKAALRELAKQHDYWQRVAEVIAELEAEGVVVTDELAAWAEEVMP